MPSIVLLSPHLEPWQDFNAALKQRMQADIRIARTSEDAITIAGGATPPLAMIIDETNIATDAMELVRRIMMKNAMIHIAWVSDQSDDAFHERTEGLGVLMKLPPHPGAVDAFQLARRLGQVTGAA